MLKRIHYGWVIVFACFILQAAVIGIYLNSISLYIPQILNEFGFLNGDFAISITIRTIACAFTVGLSARFYNSRSYKYIYCIFSIISSVTFGIQIFFTKLYQWYIANVILGLSIGMIFSVPLTILIQNWFSDKKGLALGLAMSASGVIGSILNPINSIVISSYGWRTGIVMLSVLSSLMIIPTALFLVRWKPEDCGMTPYGNSNNLSVEVKENSKSSKEIIFLALLVCVLSCAITQYVNSISVFIDAIGLSIKTAGYVASASMVGNLAGKLIIGIMADKIGIMKASLLTLAMIGLGFVFFIVSASPMLLIVGSFFYGLSMSYNSLAPGLLAAETCSAKEKAAMVGKATSYGIYVSALYYVAISYSYDLFGSFIPSFIIALIITAICIVLVIAIDKKIRKN